MSAGAKTKKILAPLKMKDGKTHWMEIGAVSASANGDLLCYFDALPINGKVVIK